MEERGKREGRGMEEREQREGRDRMPATRQTTGAAYYDGRTVTPGAAVGGAVGRAAGWGGMEWNEVGVVVFRARAPGSSG